jgi:acyl-CoA reductase-like NAD-dependent aldehyde dehydrogenase
MISFTGSEPVGVQIQKDAADTVKRVGLELGGKSAWIVLDDASMAENVAGATAGMMGNSGQTCSAGSRLLVPAARLDEAIAASASRRQQRHRGRSCRAISRWVRSSPRASTTSSRTTSRRASTKARG